MASPSRTLLLLSAPVVFAPTMASAMTFVQALGIFNIFVGLFLVATLLVFFGSLSGYIARLGTWPSNRDIAIRGLEWAVAMLFVLVVLLGVVQSFERNPQIATFLLAAVVILVILFYVIRAAATGGGKAKKEEKKPPAKH